METIYNHNITEEEKKYIGKDVFTEEEYKGLVDQDSAYSDLFCLYRFRGDMKKANEFRDKIEDEEYKWGVGYRDIFTLD